MPRHPNTTDRGGAFPPQTIHAVWQKGYAVPGRDPALWRADRCGALMQYNAYGDTSSKTGWEVDHILPVARGGTDDLVNLQPLQWENNRRKGDTFPWNC